MNKNINQIEFEATSNRNLYHSVIESLLFVSGEPLKASEIAGILECSIDFVNGLMEEVARKYDQEDRGMTLIKLNETYQLVTKADNSDYVQKLLKTNIRQSLSQAALEALAIIAYKQPVTRIAIDEIRGVKSERAVATLLEKKLVKESGRLDVPGRPMLFSTTDEFLKSFGLQNLKQMPNLDTLMESFEDAETGKEEEI